MQPVTSSDPNAARKGWMSLLAKAPAARLAELWEASALPDSPAGYEWLRRPESGAVMLRGRAGAVGAPFNLGEMTVTRGALRLPSGEVGHAWVQGRDKRKATLAALADALMQTEAAERVETAILAPLRKDAAARVWVKRGTGQMKINGKDVTEYFARPVLQMILAQPFEAAERVGEFDVVATVRGGGLSGQAGAVRHGISRALTHFEPGLRPALKAGGFLTRDPRVVERKKYGKAKARRSFQFSKR